MKGSVVWRFYIIFRAKIWHSYFCLFYFDIKYWFMLSWQDTRSGYQLRVTLISAHINYPFTLWWQSTSKTFSLVACLMRRTSKWLSMTYFFWELSVAIKPANHLVVCIIRKSQLFSICLLIHSKAGGLKAAKKKLEPKWYVRQRFYHICYAPKNTRYFSFFFFF